jgi:hypothetical protein
MTLWITADNYLDQFNFSSDYVVNAVAPARAMAQICDA